jgi:ABC-type transporter Mla subunit MlaD
MVGKACFTNAMGLRAGAPVGFAGVDRGSVKSVRAKPEVKNSPVEVGMVFNPRYELKIPNDATVLLETAGILGETFVDIDAASATGLPIGANAVLRAEPTLRLTTEQFIEKLSEALGKENRVSEQEGRRSCKCCEGIPFHESITRLTLAIS